MKTAFLAAIAITMFAASATFAADLNSADAASIAKDGIGIGPAKAEMIVKEREKGPFKDWTDVSNRVKGIGPATVSKNQTTLTFGAAPAAAVPATK